MKVHLLAIGLLIAIALAVPAVPAMIIEEKNGYTVSTVDDSARSLALAAKATYTITQGQTRWHSSFVPSGSTSFITDLNWGNSANSLTKTIYVPDGSTLGPYSDSSDGTVNGRIYLSITRTQGIPSGTWYSQVYGASVSGTQSYSYSTYVS